MTDPITFGAPVHEAGVRVGTFPTLTAGIWYLGLSAPVDPATEVKVRDAVTRTLPEEGGVAKVGASGSGMQAFIQLTGVWDVVLLDAFNAIVAFTLLASGAGPLPIPPDRYDRENEAALRKQIERVLRENADNIRSLADLVPEGVTLVADPKRVVAAPLPPPPAQYDKANEAAMRSQVERALREQAEAIRAIAEALVA